MAFFDCTKFDGFALISPYADKHMVVKIRRTNSGTNQIVECVFESASLKVALVRYLELTRV